MKQIPDTRSRRAAPLWRIGIDTGGTFTDLYAVGPRGCLSLKVLSTPEDPARGVLAALEQFLDLRPEARAAPILVVHGSTIATNALLENRLSRVAFVTNSGFEDLIEIGRQNRPDLYDLFPRRPEPWVERSHRFGIAERTEADGRRTLKPTSAAIRRIGQQLRRLKPQSIAIGLLHSFAHPRAERELAAALRRMLQVPVTPSSQIAPRVREYERYSTAIANAGLIPGVQGYLKRLEHAIGRPKLFVMQSNGGWTSASDAASSPVRLVLSGPAGGVAAAEHFFQRLGGPGWVALDMGGTSTDVSLIRKGSVRIEQVEVGGRPLLVDSVDLRSIGAGGGSILWLDGAGALRVGPRSAGSNPGPACYGRSELATLTDAHLLLGRICDRRPLAASIALDVRRSRRALEPLARHFRCSVETVALAALDIADATMEKAIKKITLERGVDPRDLRLFAFGGAGGLHACRLARRIGMRGVIVPPAPGATSAYGMAIGAARIDRVQGLVRTLGLPRRRDPAAMRRLATLARALESAAARTLVEELGPGPVHTSSRVAVRYLGQSFEISLPQTPSLLDDFVAEHRRRYGFVLDEMALQCVAVEATAQRPGLSPSNRAVRSRAAAPRDAGDASWIESQRGRLHRVKVSRLERSMIDVRGAVGPCLVLDPTATLCVETGFRVRSDRAGCLILEPAARRPSSAPRLMQGEPSR